MPLLQTTVDKDETENLRETHI